MSEQILSVLRNKLEETSSLGFLDPETKRNTLKEELQYHVLNFIYHHPEYSRWIMYGGSALRICHDLDRMSVDLDFEVADEITSVFLATLKKDFERHFRTTYGADSSFLAVKITTGRGLLLKFYVGRELAFGDASDQVHVKIDLNHFVEPKTVTERIPINRNQLSFVIVTYNMSALMASKVAAIFLRGTRGVGREIFNEKGRDIYDLLWYMGKKIVPDFDYLRAKNVNFSDPRTLLDKLTLKMNAVNDVNLRQDLTPLFTNRAYIENWLQNWRETYLRLVDRYAIRTVTKLREIMIGKNIMNGTYLIDYFYDTEEGHSVVVRYALSEYWIIFREGDLTTKVNENVLKLVTNVSKDNFADKLKQYISLFYGKNQKYLEKTKRIILGDSIDTKMIRMTADKLDQKEQIVLNKSTLTSCELDDLLK